MGDVANEFARGGDLVEYICGKLDELPEANQHSIVRFLEDRYHTRRYQGHVGNPPKNPVVYIDND